MNGISKLYKRIKRLFLHAIMVYQLILPFAVFLIAANFLQVLLYVGGTEHEMCFGFMPLTLKTLIAHCGGKGVWLHNLFKVGNFPSDEMIGWVFIIQFAAFIVFSFTFLYCSSSKKKNSASGDARKKADTDENISPDAIPDKYEATEIADAMLENSKKRTKKLLILLPVILLAEFAAYILLTSYEYIGSRPSDERLSAGYESFISEKITITEEDCSSHARILRRKSTCGEVTVYYCPGDCTVTIYESGTPKCAYKIDYYNSPVKAVAEQEYFAVYWTRCPVCVRISYDGQILGVYMMSGAELQLRW